MAEFRTTARQPSMPSPDSRSVAQVLVENLGPQLLALAVDADVQTVSSWASSTENKIRPDTEQRLRDVFAVFQMLREVEAGPVVRAWFMGMNPQLDDRSPAEAVRDGDSRAVMSAARTFINSGG